MKRNLSILLMLAGCCFGAQQQDSATLAVIVRPEVLLTAGPSAVNLKIRLSEGASAQVWTADNCTAPPTLTSRYDASKSGQIIWSSEDAAIALFSISKSGTYQIELSSLSGKGKNVCLLSSDGLRAQAHSN